MTWVKRGFGVFILALAVYYGFLACRGWIGTSEDRQVSDDGARHVRAEDQADLKAQISDAVGQGWPVFLDFWATWCKNCHAMEATTFRQPDVRARLKGYVVIKVQSERPQDAAVKAVLERFMVKGLPTYVVLKASGKLEGNRAAGGKE